MRALILRRVALIEPRARVRCCSDVPGWPNGPARRVSSRATAIPRPCWTPPRRRGPRLVERLGVHDDELPLMLCPNGTVLKRPTDAEAAMCLGITPGLDPDKSTMSRWSGPAQPGLRPPSTPRPRLIGAGARPARLRRPGGRLGADRELPGLPDRHLRPGARRPGLHPGAEVRRGHHDSMEVDALALRRRRGAGGSRPEP